MTDRRARRLPESSGSTAGLADTLRFPCRAATPMNPSSTAGYRGGMETADAVSPGRSGAQIAAMLMGMVFLVVGIAGFIPGITTHYSDMSFASHMSEAKLLGLFQVSILHNLVHLLFGIVGIALASRPTRARGYLIIGGLVYFLLFLYGLFVPEDSAANFVPMNNADDVLHILLAVAMIGLGVLYRQGPRSVERTSNVQLP
jgi:hypothetical protein